VERLDALIDDFIVRHVARDDGNIGEAYSRSSGKERALRFEYALGETRESMSWYKGGRAILSLGVES